MDSTGSHKRSRSAGAARAHVIEHNTPPGSKERGWPSENDSCIHASGTGDSERDAAAAGAGRATPTPGSAATSAAEEPQTSERALPSGSFSGGRNRAYSPSSTSDAGFTIEFTTGYGARVPSCPHDLLADVVRSPGEFYFGTEDRSLSPALEGRSLTSDSAEAVFLSADSGSSAASSHSASGFSSSARSCCSSLEHQDHLGVLSCAVEIDAAALRAGNSVRPGYEDFEGSEDGMTDIRAPGPGSAKPNVPVPTATVTVRSERSASASSTSASSSRSQTCAAACSSTSAVVPYNDQFFLKPDSEENHEHQLQDHHDHFQHHTASLSTSVPAGGLHAAPVRLSAAHLAPKATDSGDAAFLGDFGKLEDGHHDHAAKKGYSGGGGKGILKDGPGPGAHIGQHGDIILPPLEKYLDTLSVDDGSTVSPHGTTTCSTSAVMSLAAAADLASICCPAELEEQQELLNYNTMICAEDITTAPGRALLIDEAGDEEQDDAQSFFSGDPGGEGTSCTDTSNEGGNIFKEVRVRPQGGGRLQASRSRNRGREGDGRSHVLTEDVAPEEVLDEPSEEEEDEMKEEELPQPAPARVELKAAPDREPPRPGAGGARGRGPAGPGDLGEPHSAAASGSTSRSPCPGGCGCPTIPSASSGPLSVGRAAVRIESDDSVSSDGLYSSCCSWPGAAAISAGPAPPTCAAHEAPQDQEGTTGSTPLESSQLHTDTSEQRETESEPSQLVQVLPVQTPVEGAARLVSFTATTHSGHPSSTTTSTSSTGFDFWSRHSTIRHRGGATSLGTFGMPDDDHPFSLTSASREERDVHDYSTEVFQVLRGVSSDYMSPSAYGSYVGHEDQGTAGATLVPALPEFDEEQEDVPVYSADNAGGHGGRALLHRPRNVRRGGAAVPTTTLEQAGGAGGGERNSRELSHRQPQRAVPAPFGEEGGHDGWDGSNNDEQAPWWIERQRTRSKANSCASAIVAAAQLQASEPPATFATGTAPAAAPHRAKNASAAMAGAPVVVSSSSFSSSGKRRTARHDEGPQTLCAEALQRLPNFGGSSSNCRRVLPPPPPIPNQISGPQSSTSTENAERTRNLMMTLLAAGSHGTQASAKAQPQSISAKHRQSVSPAGAAPAALTAQHDDENQDHNLEDIFWQQTPSPDSAAAGAAPVGGVLPRVVRNDDEDTPEKYYYALLRSAQGANDRAQTFLSQQKGHRLYSIKFLLDVRRAMVMRGRRLQGRAGAGAEASSGATSSRAGGHRLQPDRESAAGADVGSSFGRDLHGRSESTSCGKGRGNGNSYPHSYDDCAVFPSTKSNADALFPRQTSDAESMFLERQATVEALIERASNPQHKHQGASKASILGSVPWEVVKPSPTPLELLQQEKQERQKKTDHEDPTTSKDSSAGSKRTEEGLNAEGSADQENYNADVDSSSSSSHVLAGEQKKNHGHATRTGTNRHPPPPQSRSTWLTASSDENKDKLQNTSEVELLPPRKAGPPKSPAPVDHVVQHVHKDCCTFSRLDVAWQNVERHEQTHSTAAQHSGGARTVLFGSSRANGSTSNSNFILIGGGGGGSGLLQNPAVVLTTPDIPIANAYADANEYAYRDSSSCAACCAHRPAYSVSTSSTLGPARPPPVPSPSTTRATGAGATGMATPIPARPEDPNPNDLGADRIPRHRATCARQGFMPTAIPQNELHGRISNYTGERSQKTCEGTFFQRNRIKDLNEQGSWRRGVAVGGGGAASSSRSRGGGGRGGGGGNRNAGSCRTVGPQGQGGGRSTAVNGKSAGGKEEKRNRDGQNSGGF